MEEINAWGAYEAGTTQNARPLERTSVRHRFVSLSTAPGKIPSKTAPPFGSDGVATLKKTDTEVSKEEDTEEINAWGTYEAGTSQTARQLGRTIARHQPATDSTSPRKTSSKTALAFGTDEVATLKKTDAEASKLKERKELFDLARSVFNVYFTTQDSATGIAVIHQTKKKRLYKKIIGTMPSLPKYLAKLQLPKPIVDTVLFTEASFRGIAQVYFQNNPLSGMLILAGIFVQSSRVAVHGVIAIIAGNLAGLLMGFDKSFLACGLFGYNSFLVGLALATFYSPEKHEGYYWPVVIGVIIFAYFSSVLFVMMGKILSPYKTPPFTLPFNVATILFLLAMGGMNNVDMAPVLEPALPSYTSSPEGVPRLTTEAFFAGSIRGLGQVYLTNNVVAGVLVLAGIMVCSRISALAAFVGSAIGAGVAALVGCDSAAIEDGMFGFNPSLTLTACLMFYVPSIGSILMGIVASIMTVFIQLALATCLAPTGLPFLTLPFCIAALVFIVIQGTTSNVISVPLSSMTIPEDHLKRVSRLSSGFDLLFGAIRSSSYKGSCRRNSWKISGKGGANKLDSALSEYNEVVHGESEKGFLARMLQWCKQNNNSNVSEGLARSISFRISTAMEDNTDYEEETKSYIRIFRHIEQVEAKWTSEISPDAFREFLQSVFGVVDEAGLDFACKTFQLLDLDESGGMDIDKFIVLAKISRSMPAIRHPIVKFFDFVNVNGDGAVEISDLDGARTYLGLPPLSEIDRNGLIAISNKNKELDFDTIVNFVTIFKLELIVTEYQQKCQHGSFPQELH